MKIKTFYKYAMAIVVTLSLGLQACERDDVCGADAPTTPLLIIKFLNVDNPQQGKTPVELTLKEFNNPDNTEILTFEAVDSIAIPLRINPNNTDEIVVTDYEFIINSNNEDPDQINSDIWRFSYTTEEEYVSTACGFRAVYKGLTFTPIDPTSDDNKWIDDVIIQQQNIIDETAAHISILH